MFDIFGCTAANVFRALQEQNKFEDYLKTLTKEEADKLRAERKATWEKEEEHRKKLEIAEAGRARNFWGN